MKIFSKSKINVAVGVLTGLLVGFVFGAAFDEPGKITNFEGKVKGNVSELARYRYNDTDKVFKNNIGAKTDTLKLNAVDNDGQSWTIIMTK